MTGLLKKRERGELGRYERFDRMFEEWMKAFPFRGRGLWGRDWAAGEMIRVDEFEDNGTLVVRAELPGVDPAKDVEVTFTDGVLTITAERREEERKEEKGYVRQELTYGTFSRTLTLPEGVSEADIKASYNNGILEIRVPPATPVTAPAKKIPIDKS